MPLPTEVKIAGVTYTVEEQENLINIEDYWPSLYKWNHVQDSA